MGKPEGKRPLGRPKHRWEDNIKMDLITDPIILPRRGFFIFHSFYSDNGIQLVKGSGG